jgi:hypothetical protein
MQIPHDAVTNQPLQAVPAGFIMGVPPVVTAPTGNLNRGDKNDDQGPDMDAWKNKYTYSDPDALAGETLGAINKEQSSLSKFFKNSPVNQFLQATAIGELKSNIDYLEARGYDSDKIAEMKAALAVRTESRLGDTANLGSIINYALTNTSNLTNKILEEYGSDPFKKLKTTKTVSDFDSVGGGVDEARKIKESREKDGPTEKQKEADTRVKAALAKSTDPSKAEERKEKSRKTVSTETARSSAKKAADKLGTKLATGGRAKGGLMQKNKKKKKK